MNKPSKYPEGRELIALLKPPDPVILAKLIAAMTVKDPKPKGFPFRMRESTPEIEDIARRLLLFAESCGFPRFRIFCGASHSHYRINDRVVVLADGRLLVALHELAHHLYGTDERVACAWSGSLYLAYAKRVLGATSYKVKGHDITL